MRVKNVNIDEITIGDRVRKDMGDLQKVADGITAEGLLEPIAVTKDNTLVFGHRRLLACRDILLWTAKRFIRTK